MATVDDDLYPCPCCGYLVFGEAPGSYDICPLCGWEDDLSQLRFPTMGGANEPLIDSQDAWVDASGTDLRGREYRRDPEWRPIDPARDGIERPTSGVDYGATYHADRTRYYYWRSRP